MSPKLIQKAQVFIFLIILAFSYSCKEEAQNEKVNFNHNWKFLRLSEYSPSENGFQKTDFADDQWENVNLPHSAHIEPYVCNDMWQGTCWYRKRFFIPKTYEAKKLILEFEGAMGKSEFWINGKKAMTHAGGYLPVVFDISEKIIPGEENIIAIKLDNRDNPLTGPKPLKRLDFCFYGGLYRNASLILKDKVHITHPATAETIAGGGIFIHTPNVSREESVVQVKTQIANESKETAKVKLIQQLIYNNKILQTIESEMLDLGKTSDKSFVQNIKVQGAKLWSPKTPHLYTLNTTLVVDGIETETETTRFGIREFKFVDNELYINGKKTYLRGTNRHQEYPYVGYALSDNAQYRDAKKIKDAGFDYIRLSHYPHSPSFMDACDELGLVVLDAILGWQYYLDDDRFREYCYNSATQLIRRDRNHACVLAWEVSLNETKMPKFFMKKLHKIVHSEYPYKYAYSAGWQPEVYDIFLQARQHRILHPVELPNKPYMVSEYGDWEYYSRNAGLNQHNLDKQMRIEKSSRQLREYGEARLLQQSYNLQEAYNDNMATTPAFSDGFWVMYDYNSGVHSGHCCSGVMDMNRIRKPSSWFYQSQRDLDEDTVVHIASFWTKDSPLDVKVYSNCDEVELFLNGKSFGKQAPDSDKNSSHLDHPPFTFKVDQFKAGKLEAFGFIKGKKIAKHQVLTPAKATKLKIWLEESGKKPTAGCNDVLFAYIAAVDENGMIVRSCTDKIIAETSGDIKILNKDNLKMEAGIATLLVQIGEKAEPYFLDVNSDKLSGKLSFTPVINSK